MDNPLLEILIILLLLVVNGLFAMSEIAMVSARKARLQQEAEAGDVNARAALELATNPNDFLSAVQIGITLVGILAGAFGGATIAEELEGYLTVFPELTPYSEAISVAIVVLGITYFSLVVGELVPKRVGLNNAETIASAVAAPMRVLTRGMAPFVRILGWSTDWVLWGLGIRPSTEPAVTEEEIKVLIDQGTQIGVFREAEQDMIEGVLRLGERRVGALMTPRSQVVCFRVDDSLEVIRKKLSENRYSGFPLVVTGLDDLVGMVYTQDLLAQALGNESLNLQAIAQEAVYVLDQLPALQVLEVFKREGVQSALVFNEFGVIQGMITHNDILEDIVGYMPLIQAGMEPSIVVRGDGSWLVDGLLPIEKLKEWLRVEVLPNEESRFFQTVGGFVFSQMGRVPTAGEGFAWGDYVFEIVDMDFRRVDKVLVRRAGGET